MQSMKYIWLGEADNLPDIGEFSPFKTLLSIDETASTARQHEISTWLVRMGARHVTIRGEDCLSWKESIRHANLEMVSLDDMQPEQFVMITTHPHEGLRSVFRQVSKHASHTHVDLNITIIIHLSEQSSENEYRSIFSRL